MYVDFEQGLVALNNVPSFLRLRNMFVYMAPDGHHVNSKSLSFREGIKDSNLATR